MEYEAEAMRDEIIRWIKEDDDFYSFILLCFGNGLRKAMEDIENGIDNEETELFKMMYKNLDLASFMHTH